MTTTQIDRLIALQQRLATARQRGDERVAKHLADNPIVRPDDRATVRDAVLLVWMDGELRDVGNELMLILADAVRRAA